jgi:hypothetical protein
LCSVLTSYKAAFYRLCPYNPTIKRNMPIGGIFGSSAWFFSFPQF